MYDDIRLLCNAAWEIGRDGVLPDPTDSELLIAAAELCGSKRDLSLLTPIQVSTIVDAWYRGDAIGREAR